MRGFAMSKKQTTAHLLELAKTPMSGPVQPSTPPDGSGWLNTKSDELRRYDAIRKIWITKEEYEESPDIK